MERTVHSLAELEALMPQVHEALAGRRKVALIGDMGAGKTTFVKTFCAWLGVNDLTSSPTYALVNQYAFQDNNGHEIIVHHLDLYRLNSLAEALDIGIEDLLYDPWYCFIEWPELIEPILPSDTVFLRISLLQNGARSLELT